MADAQCCKQHCFDMNYAFKAEQAVGNCTVVVDNSQIGRSSEAVLKAYCSCAQTLRHLAVERGTRSALTWCMPAGLNKQWGLSNELFVLGDSLVLTVLGQVSFMPILVLAARLCPEVWQDVVALSYMLASRPIHGWSCEFQAAFCSLRV